MPGSDTLRQKEKKEGEKERIWKDTRQQGNKEAEMEANGRGLK